MRDTLRNCLAHTVRGKYRVRVEYPSGLALGIIRRARLGFTSHTKIPLADPSRAVI